MVRKNSFRPNCEALEPREVPALVVQGTFTMAGVAPTPNGGNVTVQEVALTNADTVTNQAFTALDPQTKSATANDSVTFTLSGGTLTINSADGIFIRYSTNGTNTFHQNRGTTLTINGVTGLNVDLQLGGSDSVTDNTQGLPVTINGGAGNDVINAAGSPINPALLPFLMQNPALAPLIAQMSGPPKNISGGAGMDNITVNGFAAMYMIDGGDDKDMIQGPLMGSFNQLRGGAGDDVIIGGFGQDIIFGDAGLDVIAGLGGNDFLITIDGGPDFVLNVKGDTVISDPLDSLATKI